METADRKSIDDLWPEHEALKEELQERLAERRRDAQQREEEKLVTKQESRGGSLADIEQRFLHEESREAPYDDDRVTYLEDRVRLKGEFEDLMDNPVEWGSWKHEFSKEQREWMEVHHAEQALVGERMYQEAAAQHWQAGVEWQREQDMLEVDRPVSQDDLDYEAHLDQMDREAELEHKAEQDTYRPELDPDWQQHQDAGREYLMDELRAEYELEQEALGKEWKRELRIDAENVARNERGPDELHRAVHDKNLDAVKQCIEKGMPVDSHEDGKELEWSQTPLQVVASNGDLEIAQYLVEKGAKIETRGYVYFGEDHVLNNSMTPVCNAAYEGHLDVCKLLVERGADVDEGLRWSINHLDVCKFMVSKGGDINQTIQGGEYDEKNAGGLLHNTSSKDIARFLAGVGADVSMKNEDGETAIDVHRYSPEMTNAIHEGVAAFEQQQLRANLPSVTDEMRSQGLTQTRGRRL